MERKMLVLEESVRFFKWLFGESYAYNVIMSAPMIIICISCTAYIGKNITDVTESTKAIGILAPMIIHSLQYWVFALQKEEFFGSILCLQTLVDRSIINLYIYIRSNFSMVIIFFCFRRSKFSCHRCVHKN